MAVVCGVLLCQGTMVSCMSEVQMFRRPGVFVLTFAFEVCILWALELLILLRVVNCSCLI